MADRRDRQTAQRGKGKDRNTSRTSRTTAEPGGRTGSGSWSVIANSGRKAEGQPAETGDTRVSSTAAEAGSLTDARDMSAESREAQYRAGSPSRTSESEGTVADPGSTRTRLIVRVEEGYSIRPTRPRVQTPRTPMSRKRITTSPTKTPKSPTSPRKQGQESVQSSPTKAPSSPKVRFGDSGQGEGGTSRQQGPRHPGESMEMQPGAAGAGRGAQRRGEPQGSCCGTGKCTCM